VRGGEPAADAICAGEDGGAAGGADTIRGHAAEFGLIGAKGLDKLASLLAAIEQDDRVPALARELFATLAREYAWVQVELKAIEAKLLAWHRADAMSRRLAQIPGIGPVTAAALVMKAPDPHAFRSGRLFAAWIGLTPKDHSTAGKTRLGKITRAGDEQLRQLLVVGATSVVKQAKARGRGPRWLIELLKRKTPKLAAVALANKLARIAWKLMTTGETYDNTRLETPTAAHMAAAV
jgi:transposase